MPKKKQKKGEIAEKGKGKNKPSKSEQAKTENKILKGFFMGVGIFVVLILAFVIFVNSVRHIEYRGLDFEVIKEGKLIFYKTDFPVRYNGTKATYSIYIRNDPRDLEKEVPFSDDLDLKKIMVLNSTSDFNCQGDGLIAVGNFVKMQIFDMQIIKDQNATCDPNGAYMFVNLKEGNETKIEEIGPACYNIEINNCEIVKATERFMVEAFVEINKLL